LRRYSMLARAARFASIESIRVAEEAQRRERGLGLHSWKELVGGYGAVGFHRANGGDGHAQGLQLRLALRKGFHFLDELFARAAVVILGVAATFPEHDAQEMVVCGFAGEADGVDKSRRLLGVRETLVDQLDEFLLFAWFECDFDESCVHLVLLKVFV